MVLFFRKREGVSAMTGMAKLSFVVLLTAFSISLINTIFAVYIDSFVHNESAVGFISAILIMVALLSYFIFIPFIEKNSKTKIYGFSLLMLALTYLLFALNRKLYIFVVLAGIAIIFHTLRITSFGIIMKEKSPKKKLSRNEGLVYTFMNIAWVIGPLVAGWISNKYNIQLVFALAAIFLFLAFIFFRLSKINVSHITKKSDGNLIKNFFAFFRDKKRTLAYLLGGGPSLWWAFIYIFVPLHIIRSGLQTLWVGYFLFAIAVPLILSEYIFARMAGKIGFKKTFKIGFAIVTIISFICFFIENIYLLLSLLVLASFGFAMLEPTTVTYFLDTLKKKDENRFFGPYNTTAEVYSLTGRISASVLLLFLPFKYLFFLFGGFMFLLFLLSHRIKDIIEDKRK